MKKHCLITGLLALALLMTGCAHSGEPAAVVPEATAAAGTPVEVSIGFWNTQDLDDITDKDAVWRYIEERFGVRIRTVSVGWANYHDEYQIMAGTDTLPDIFADVTVSSSIAENQVWLQNMIRAGSLRALPDDLSAYPRVGAIIQRASYTCSEDGRMYVLPRPSLDGTTVGFSDAGMIVRKDWMETLGLSDPETVEDFVALAAAFANDDPDGNGLADTIGYNVNNRAALGKWLMLAVAPECNVYSWISTGDSFIPSYLTAGFDRVVALYRRMYELGALDPDFYTKKSDDAVSDFARGTLGALEYKASPAALLEVKRQWTLYHDETQPFEECVKLLHVPRCADGKYYSNTSEFFWSETLFSASVDDEKMARVLSLYEFLLSDEGYRLTHYGLEGVDYRLDANGDYQCLLPLAKDEALTQALLAKYPSLKLFLSLATWGGSRESFMPSEFNRLQYGEYIMRIVNEQLLWAEANTVFVERPYPFLLMPKEDTDIFSTTNAQDDFARAIISDTDALESWHASVNAYYALGLRAYIDRQNERARALGILP